MNSFYNDVFDVVKQIPFGRVTTYGAIAAFLGAKKSARMVGWALNGSLKTADGIPAHRVVNRNGMLSGKIHFGTPHRMEELLKSEGVMVENDSVTEFEKLFWDPAKELSL